MNWAFEDPPNTAAVTMRQVVFESQPVLLVVRDAEAGWQFLTGGPFDVTDGLLVALKNVIEQDPSLTELADLPLGWEAVRESLGAAWHRRPSEESIEEVLGQP